MRIRMMFVRSLLILFSIALTAQAETTDSCGREFLQHLVGDQNKVVGFEEITSSTNYPLPKEAIQAIHEAAIQELSKRYDQGKNLVIALEYYDPAHGITRGFMGESIQSQFVAKTLKEVLPEAKIVRGTQDMITSVGYEHLREEHPFDQILYMGIIDIAEMGGDFGYPTLNMALVKPANPGFASLKHNALRGKLGIPESYKVNSFYFYDGGHISSDINPSVSAILNELETHEKPNLVFISRGGSTFGDEEVERLKGELNSDYEQYALSQFHEIDLKPDGHYIINNDLRGKLPVLYNISDQVVVSGPINIFEPLNARSKTIFFENSSVLGHYDPKTFSVMADQAVRSNGALKVTSLSDLKAKIEPWLKSKPIITPPYLIKENNLSPFDHYLKHLQETVLAADAWDKEFILKHPEFAPKKNTGLSH